MFGSLHSKLFNSFYGTMCLKKHKKEGDEPLDLAQKNINDARLGRLIPPVRIPYKHSSEFSALKEKKN